jgi:predicted O-methyltransferase YrrM
MSGITYDYMEQYLRGLIGENTGILKDLEDFAVENSVPIVQKEVGRFLELMVTLKKPMRILELGTAIGYSAILMYLASDKKTEIVTIERDDNMAAIAESNLLKYGMENDIKVIKGDCIEVLQALNEEFDMIFMDAGKGHYKHFLPDCLRLLSGEGVIIADNVLFRGMVASRELLVRRKITIVKRMKSYLEEVSNNPELLTSVLPMGDGIAVTVRRNLNEKA